MWKEIKRKWVPVHANKGTVQKGGEKGKMYINEAEKEVDAAKYIDSKLDTMYNELEGKMRMQDEYLERGQARIMQGLLYIDEIYRKQVLHK